MRKILIFIIILFSFFSGCKNYDNNITYDFGSLNNNIVNYVEVYEFNEPKIVEGDDYFEIQFERERIGSVNVEKRVRYYDDYNGEIELSLEGEGEFILNIPKSFAQSVSDIEFSVEPDEIINDDPIVKWMVKQSDKRLKNVVIKVKEAAFASATDDPIGTLGTFFSDGGIEGVKKAGIQKGSDELLNHLEDFMFIADLDICGRKKSENDKYICVMKMVDNHPEWFDCDKMFAHSEVLRLSCRAVRIDDESQCSLSKKENEKDRDGDNYDCRHFLFLTKSNKCELLFSEERIKCFKEEAYKNGFFEGCNKIADEEERKNCEDLFDEDYVISDKNDKGRYTYEDYVKSWKNSPENSNNKDGDDEKKSEKFVESNYDWDKEKYGMTEEEFCEDVEDYCPNWNMFGTMTRYFEDLYCVCTRDGDVDFCENDFCNEITLRSEAEGLGQ